MTAAASATATPTSDDRPRQPLLGSQKLGIDAALDKAAELLKGKRVIGIGSPRASLESNHALRELVGDGQLLQRHRRRRAGLTCA